jgi:hypothetical protein
MLSELLATSLQILPVSMLCDWDWFPSYPHLQSASDIRNCSQLLFFLQSGSSHANVDVARLPWREHRLNLGARPSRQQAVLRKTGVKFFRQDNTPVLRKTGVKFCWEAILFPGKKTPQFYVKLE